jgi:hypothetical protein
MSVATKEHKELKEKPVFDGFFFVIFRGKKSGRPLIEHPNGRNGILAVVQGIWLQFYLKFPNRLWKNSAEPR